jgi:phosphoesterase RecJ-like protein
MEQIVQKIKTAKRPAVVSHADPDGDAIGSLLAMGLALIKSGKQTTLYNAGTIPAVYRFLPGVDRIVHRLEAPENHDLALVLDCGDPSRIGEECRSVERIGFVINIDHHVSNTGFGQMRLIDTQACATAEIVYRIIRALGVPFDPAIAAAVYTGILTDTGSFRFSNTNAAAFAISCEMMEAGADPYDVAQHVYGTYSLGRIKLLNLALNSIEISRNGSLSIMTITRGMLAETGTQPEDADGMINYARRIQDIKVAALIHEYANGRASATGRALYHVSLRSDGRVDVAALAGSFGGGGHASAAGFQTDAPLSEIKSALIAWSERILPGA